MGGLHFSQQKQRRSGCGLGEKGGGGEVLEERREWKLNSGCKILEI